MTNKDIYREIGDIDANLIVNAAPDCSRKRIKKAWVKWVSIAACLCLIVTAGFEIQHILSKNTVEVSSPKNYFLIEYVDCKEIKVETKYLSADMGVIIGEWLKLNGLDTQYMVIRTCVYDDYFTDYPEIKENEYCFVFEEYVFYFSSDINEFLTKEENNLYLEALNKTLGYADSVISEMVDQGIEERFGD